MQGACTLYICAGKWTDMPSGQGIPVPLPRSLPILQPPEPPGPHSLSGSASFWTRKAQQVVAPSKHLRGVKRVGAVIVGSRRAHSIQSLSAWRHEGMAAKEYMAWVACHCFACSIPQPLLPLLPLVC